jgi:transcriptional regulator with XRE-family HTH domain
MEKTIKDLGKRVKTIRKVRGLTQEELGEKASLSYKFIGEVERGKVNPSFNTLLALAKALNIDIGQLFTENWQLPLDYQLSPQDIQLIKDALPFLNQILKIFTDLNKIFSGWKIKELECIKRSLISLNKLFLKE